MTTTGLIGTHLIPAAHDHGLGDVPAASLLAVIGAFDIVGTVASGYLTDRFDSRWLLFWYYGLRGLSLIALPADRRPYRADLRPGACGLVFGWIFASHQFGAAAAAAAAGALRDWQGDYTLTFVGGELALLASALVLRIRVGAVPLRTASAEVT